MLAHRLDHDKTVLPIVWGMKWVASKFVFFFFEQKQRRIKIAQESQMRSTTMQYYWNDYGYDAETKDLIIAVEAFWLAKTEKGSTTCLWIIDREHIVPKPQFTHSPDMAASNFFFCFQKYR